VAMAGCTEHRADRTMAFRRDKPLVFPETLAGLREARIRPSTGGLITMDGQSRGPSLLGLIRCASLTHTVLPDWLAQADQPEHP
jgi:hypothetical protein